MPKSSYVPIPRRRRMGVTNYTARRKSIISPHVLLVINRSNKNVTAQFITPKVQGDLVLSSSHSRNLRSVGWKGSLKSTPACYLLGLYAGKRAQEKGVKEAYVYSGVLPFVKGSRVAALVKGVVDSGVEVPISDDALPSEERMKGASIAKYAADLLKEDKEQYEKRFSALIKAGLRPEDYPAHCEEVKIAITGKAAGAGKK